MLQTEPPAAVQNVKRERALKALEKAQEAKLRKKLEREEALKAKIQAEKEAERERQRKEFEEIARKVWAESKTVGSGRPKPKKKVELPPEDVMDEDEEDVFEDEETPVKPQYFAKTKNKHHQTFPPEPEPSKQQMMYYQVFS